MRTQIFNFARTITQTKNCDWLSIWTFPLSLCSHCRRFYLSVFPSLVARIPLVRFACSLHCLIDEFCSVTILQFHNYASKTQCSRVDFAVKVAHTVKTRGSSCLSLFRTSWNMEGVFLLRSERWSSAKADTILFIAATSIFCELFVFIVILYQCLHTRAIRAREHSYKCQLR